MKLAFREAAPDVLDLLAGVIAWSALAALGWWLVGDIDGFPLWRVFAGAGISGYLGGWWVGTRPIRRMEQDWQRTTPEPSWLPWKGAD